LVLRQSIVENLLKNGTRILLEPVYSIKDERGGLRKVFTNQLGRVFGYEPLLLSLLCESLCSELSQIGTKPLTKNSDRHNRDRHEYPLGNSTEVRRHANDSDCEEDRAIIDYHCRCVLAA